MQGAARSIQRNDSKTAIPPIEIFTFCAEGALDVLLLDRERIIRRSSNDEFDTVYFFDNDDDAISETRKRIPGAIGFPGDFFDVVLEGEVGAGLDTPQQSQNTRQVRERQLRKAQHDQFKAAFPFDVMNLDVERYLFRPREELPGKVVQALRLLLEWQKQLATDSTAQPFGVNEFCLMFTTQVGPRELPDSYLDYLRSDCITRNLEADAELNQIFLRKSNGRNVPEFFRDDFDGAFKLAVPKSLIELVGEADWYVDSVRGIEIYQFDRDYREGSYRMLHMAMTVRRQSPPKERRGPGQPIPNTAAIEQKTTIRKLFGGMVGAVEEIVVGKLQAELQADLDRLFAHRRRYYDPPLPRE
jgi:hypothetical protein